MNIPRIAAGMSMANSDGKRHTREYDPLKRESRVGAFLAIALFMLFLCVGLPVAWGG